MITMWPDPGDPGNGWPEAALAWLHALGLPSAVDLAVIEALANVAMFVPLGALVLLVTRLPRAGVVAAGATFSMAIELTQLTLLPHRFATVQDVVMNTLGAAVGVALAAAARARLDAAAPETETETETETEMTAGHPDGYSSPATAAPTQRHGHPPGAGRLG